MRILAIETSCDETAASVVVAQSDDTVTLESTIVSSQVALHAAWGGNVCFFVWVCIIWFFHTLERSCKPVHWFCGAIL